MPQVEARTFVLVEEERTKLEKCVREKMSALILSEETGIGLTTLEKIIKNGGPTYRKNIEKIYAAFNWELPREEMQYRPSIRQEEGENVGLCRRNESITNCATSPTSSLVHSIEKTGHPSRHKSYTERSLRVLIADDAPLSTLQIRKALLRASHEVICEAVTGKDAVGAALTLRPDLIFMDINMVGSIDGLTASREILKYLTVPIIVITAYADEISIAQAMDIGVTSFLVKPLTSEQILSSVQIALIKFTNKL